ncbi:alpha-amylase family glycosyl hydrolase [Limnovirga soli]|uniref:T9SS type A sorting domain-containing protein n=1 Tax=Limnovirga soli TaxID=2656915 RepID=A0A8J8JWK7_9BACT|nr:alpha-amylase family glycosyl hydrolase [Limnovirga soli]NNV57844.1 T9SS type A sorting domain-containing protein [Limnovirga soli]
MKKYLILPLLCFVMVAKAQLLTWTPDFIKEASTPITITVDANKGNLGLKGYTPTTDVYVHIGVITNKSASSTDWKYSKFTWATTNVQAQCTYLGSNKWKYTITGGLRTYFNITDGAETIKKIAILFRNGAGSKVQRNADASDMYIPVYDNGVYARLDTPLRQPTYVPIPEPINKSLGDPLTISAKSSIAGTLKLYLNGTELASSATTSVSASTSIGVSGDQTVVAEITSGITVHRDTIKFVVASPAIAALPAGAKDGINYEPGDTSAILVLYAPLKNNVFVLGDFNNWTQSAPYLMNVTPDFNRYWIRITHLTPGTEYAYQYLIDNAIKVADYNTEKVLDPNNDQYISTATYPNLKAYPTGKTTGIVSILQTAKPGFNWQVTNFTRPDKRNLIIYELLVRDFVAAQNWQTIKDTLSYLKRLGINAIEVMPFNEFEGNNSWGYNPSFYFAPDKAYGTETALKEFIDECHKQGIAVIMDMVFNHSFGQSPMVQMYWDGTNNRPAANSPWFNPVAKHAYNVGYDINHESAATSDFVNRVIAHWLNNYKIDGFRWDLSKGFTQKQTCDNNGANCNEGNFAAYDATRVAIWNKYYGYMQTASSGTYCILEHFADNTEEKELADNGMLLWGNSNYNFMEATMGYVPTSDFSYNIYNSAGRGWTQPNLVMYPESHDEERMMYKNETYGNTSNGSYNTKSVAVGTKRVGMAAAFWSMIPGPKMIWEFGELGYDYSRCYLSNNGEGGNCNTKTDPKPIKWDYYQNADRKALYNVYSNLVKLRTTSQYINTFTTGTMNYALSSSIKWFSTSSSDLRVMVVGNFDVTAKTATVTFPQTGTWYNYLGTGTINVPTVAYSITLQPGEYYVYTDRDVKPVVLPVTLLSFTANKASGTTVLVKWSTTNEFDNKYFEVQRSADGVSFNTIGSVNASITSAPVKNYQFTDITPLSGAVYYRLKQVDNNGKEHYSATVKINFDDKAVIWQVYPNPAHNSAAIISQANLTKVQVKLADITGKTIYRSAIINAINAGQKIEIPVSALPPGVYFITLSSQENTVTQKLVMQ